MITQGVAREDFLTATAVGEVAEPGNPLLDQAVAFALPSSVKPPRQRTTSEIVRSKTISTIGRTAVGGGKRHLLQWP